MQLLKYYSVRLKSVIYLHWIRSI